MADIFQIAITIVWMLIGIWFYSWRTWKKDELDRVVLVVCVFIWPLLLPVALVADARQALSNHTSRTKKDTKRFDEVCLEATGKSFKELNKQQMEDFQLFYFIIGYRSFDELTYQTHFSAIKEEYQDWLDK